MSFGPGEPIETLMITQDGTQLWVPAVVVSIADHQIGVAYSDGRRQMIKRGTKHYRRPERGTTLHPDH